MYLKGAAYSLLKNNTHLGRTYGDIDLLVEKQQVELSDEIGRKLGKTPYAYTEKRFAWERK